LKPTFDETAGIQISLPYVSNVPNKEALQLPAASVESLSLTHLDAYEGAEVVFHPHPHPPPTKAEFDEFQDDDEPTDDRNGTGTGGGDAPYDGDDETTDGVLALSLLGLICWISLSALLVARFIQTEKRREQMLRFWHAIDTNPDLRHAVEQGAGGGPFPKFPRHAGLHRFLRATAVALAVTVGLNLVLFMGRAPVPSAEGGKDGGGAGGGGEGGGGTGEGERGGDMPLDLTGMGDDGTSGNNPVMGVVVLFLLLASLVLIARGLYAACCTSSPPSSLPSSSSGGQQNYPGSVGGSYEPVHPSTVTPYVSMHGNSSSSNNNSSSNSSSPAQDVYYVGVPILPTSAPSLFPSSSSSSSSQQQQQEQQQQGGTEEGMEEGAPPPYSAALVAAPASTAMVV